MGILQSKSSIGSSISSLTSISNSLNMNDVLNNMNTSNNSFTNNSKDPIQFLIGLLILMVGVEAVEAIISNILVKSIPTINNDVKGVMSSTLVNNDENASMDPVLLSNGLDIPVSDIDYNKKFQSSPANSTLIPNDPNTLDYSINNSISSNGSYQTYNNLGMQYNPNTDNINVKPLVNQSNNTFFNGILKDLNFLNTTVIIAEVMNLLFGVLDSSNNKNADDINTDEVFNQMISNYVNDESIPDEQLFTLSNSDLNIIQTNIMNRLNNQLPLDFGCSNFNSTVDLETLNGILNSNNPVTGLTSVINNILPQNPDLNTVADLSPSNLASVNKQVTNNSGFANNTATKTTIYSSLVNKITLVFIKHSILSPQFLVLKKLNTRIISGDVDNSSGVSLLTSQKTLFKCITKQIKSSLSSILFTEVKKELLNLTKPITQSIVAEKANDYEMILAGLVGLK